MRKPKRLEKLLYEEACNMVCEARSATETKILLRYYIGLSIGMGFDQGLAKHQQYNQKPVIGFGRNKIRVFDSIGDAEKQLKTHHNTILKSIRSNGKYKCKGMKWEYLTKRKI